MAKVKLSAGAEIDLLSPAEFRDGLASDAELREIAALAGIRYMPDLQFLIGKAASSAISLGVDKGNPFVGPESGFIWSLSRLVVTGLQSGATPDTVIIQKNTTSTAAPTFWEFDGNHSGATFGKLQLVLNGGDSLCLINSGTFNSTSTIILTGSAIEVPAQLAGKLA